MDTLRQTVKKVVAGYAGKVLNGCSYLTRSDDDSVFTVVIIAENKGKHVTGVSLVVRIVNDYVIVERDQNDKLVRDALLQAGISRSQIVLAYAGEAVPTGV